MERKVLACSNIWVCGEQEQTRSPEQAASMLEPDYWYYCQYAKDYHPSLQSCPDGR